MAVLLALRAQFDPPRLDRPRLRGGSGRVSLRDADRRPYAGHPDPRVLPALGSDLPGADPMSDPFSGIPLAAALTDEQLSEQLGEPVRSGQNAVSTGSGRFGFAWLGGAPPWRHTSHSIGFIPPNASGAGSIRHVGE